MNETKTETRMDEIVKDKGNRVILDSWLGKLYIMPREIADNYYNQFARYHYFPKEKALGLSWDCEATWPTADAKETK